MEIDDVDKVLLRFLDGQRERVVQVVAGLSDDQLATAVLPSGWTLLGMIEHLGHAERHWFQTVALGVADPLPWAPEPDPGPDAPFTTGRPARVVFDFYGDQVAKANELLTSTPLSTRPKGRHTQGDIDFATDLRILVLHMIEETARHLGHLDAAREVLDGGVGLGQDNLVLP